MDNKRYFVVSFGDSTRYKVGFDGTKEEFETSAKLKDIKKRVDDYLQEKFPTGGYEEVVGMSVSDDDGRDFPDIDKIDFNDLLKSVERQVKVERDADELNNNAPFDSI